MKNNKLSFRPKNKFQSASTFGATIAIAVLLQGCNGEQSSNGQNGETPLTRSVQCDSGTEEKPAPFVDYSECVVAGARVIDQNNTTYSINTVYSDGRLDVSYIEYSGRTTLSYGTYFPEVYRVNGFIITNRTSRAIDQNNTRYFVGRLFANGKAELNYRDYSGDTILDIRRLAVSVPSFGTVSVGDRILDRNNTRYSVEEVYSDGRIRASYRDYQGSTFLKQSDVVVAK